MSVVPVQNAPAAETVERRFRELEARWWADTEFLSDPARIIAHPAFREIVSLGEEVVPLMLRDLEAGPRLWVWALPEITGANPVPPDDAGNIRRMSEAWLKWARENGVRW
jgi:hypothetical protein